MKCPNCDRSLAEVDVTARGLAKVHRCEHCGGCWIPKSELEGFHPGVWHNLEEMGVSAVEALSSRICPHCSAQCTEVSPEDHPELHVDRCPECHGLWLDRGELEDLYDVVVEYGEAHGTLESKPAGWSILRWLTYSAAEAWSHTHQGLGAE